MMVQFNSDIGDKKEGAGGSSKKGSTWVYQMGNYERQNRDNICMGHISSGLKMENFYN